MAKKSVIARNDLRIQQASNENTINNRQQLLDQVRKGTIEEQLAAQKKLQRYRNKSPVRVVNRCSCCGRSNGVYKKFKLCRHCLRNMINLGIIPGVKKSSW